jgi:hypothetical protein
MKNTIVAVLLLMVNNIVVFGQSEHKKFGFRQGMGIPYFTNDFKSEGGQLKLNSLVFAVGVSKNVGDIFFLDLDNSLVGNLSGLQEWIIQPGVGVNLPYRFIADTRVGYKILQDKSLFNAISLNKAVPLTEWGNGKVFLVAGAAFIWNHRNNHMEKSTGQLVSYVQIGYSF